MKRVLSIILGALATANGTLMIAIGERWFAATPGVLETGPFNPHFVADVGAAYAVAGLALLARGLRPRYWPAAVAGAAFFCTHALIHIAGVITGHSHHAVFDTGLVVLPAAISLWAAIPNKGEIHA